MGKIIQLSVFFFFSISQSLSQTVDISCRWDGMPEKIITRYPYTKGQELLLSPLNYVANGKSIYGKLVQDLGINGMGDCYDLFIRFRGVTTEGCQEWKISKNKLFDINAGTLSTPGFESLAFDEMENSLCQNIIMSREIRYNQKGHKCNHYVTFLNDSVQYKYHDGYEAWKHMKQEACVYYIGRYTYNPFQLWMSQKAFLNHEKKEPLYDIATSSGMISIDWGAVKDLNCLEKNIQDIRIQLSYKETKMILQPLNFEDNVFLMNKNPFHCHPFDLNINITMEFEELDNSAKCSWFASNIDDCTHMVKKDLTFYQTMKAPKFELKIDNTLVTICRTNGRETSFLKEFITVFFLLPKAENMELALDEDHELDITHTIEFCKEYVIDIAVNNILGETVANSNVNIFPKLADPTFDDKLSNFAIENQRFSECMNINLLLECIVEGSDKATQIYEIPGLDINLDNLTDIVILCRAKAYIVKDEFIGLRNWTDWFKPDGSEITGSLITVLVASIASSIIVLAVALTTVIILRRRKITSKENSGYRTDPSLEMQPPFIKRTEDKLYENDDDYYSVV